MNTPNIDVDAFARQWIAAWNAHDLEQTLAMFSEDVVFTSPFIVELLGREDGTVVGKAALRDYWGTALARLPELHFELEAVYPGHGSVVITFVNERGRRSADTLFFDAAGLVCRGHGHHLPHD